MPVHYNFQVSGYLGPSNAPNPVVLGQPSYIETAIERDLASVTDQPVKISDSVPVDPM